MRLSWRLLGILTAFVCVGQMWPSAVLAQQQSATITGRVTNEETIKRRVLPGMAFVSPRTGKVYRTWQECARAKARRAT